MEKEAEMDPVLEFDAEVVIFHHATLIEKGYQPIIHCGTVCQSAQVTWMDKEYMEGEDKGSIRF